MSFDLATQFQINGSASYNVDTGEIDLTTLAGGGSQAGSAFLKGVIVPPTMTELTIGYRYESVAGGADGHICLLADAATVPETAVGRSGGDRGAGGLLIVGAGEEEFGTPSWNTVNSLAGFGLSEGAFGFFGSVTGIHDVVITFTPSSPTNFAIALTVDGVPRVSGVESFASAPANGCRVGWTAGTGGSVQRHSLLSVTQFDMVIPEPNWVARRNP